VPIAGGGLTGIQTTAQIARRHSKVHVAMVSSGAIARELPGAAQAYVGRHSATSTSRSWKGAGSSPATSGGPVARSPPTSWCGPQGFVPSPLAAKAGLAVTGTGQVVVDIALRSVSHPFVFAAGDGAAVPRASSAYGAYAATVGMNSGRDLAGRPAEPGQPAGRSPLEAGSMTRTG
jgi:NADH:ubiquinone reductase (H+-translocating)